jgi:hypothetical protein
MATIIKQRVYEALPPGEYLARIGAAALEPSKFNANQSQVRVRFDITQPGFEGRDVQGFCTASFAPSTKLYAWARAAFGGRPIPVGYDLALEHLLDREVTLVLSHKPAADGSGRVYNQIDAVLPAGTQPAPMAARAAAPAPAPAPEFAPAPAAAGNGGNGVGVVRQGTAGWLAPVTAASAAGVAPQRGPVTVGGSNPNDPPDWPGWDDNREAPGAGAEEPLPF